MFNHSKFLGHIRVRNIVPWILFKIIQNIYQLKKETQSARQQKARYSHYKPTEAWHVQTMQHPNQINGLRRQTALLNFIFFWPFIFV
jgi:hypothetical protein